MEIVSHRGSLGLESPNGLMLPGFSFYISLEEDAGRIRRKRSSIKHLLDVRHCSRHLAFIISFTLVTPCGVHSHQLGEVTYLVNMWQSPT